MAKRKQLAVWGLAAVLAAVPTPAFAGSPEFARTQEEWASLRDDRLEYDEIADLIHEYNNTVIENQIAYRDELDKDNDDIAQDYYDRAEEIYGNIEYPDTDDSNYGSLMAAALSSQIQADQLMEQGDESTDDSESLKIGYDQQEAQLVQQAQEQMISYWSQYYSLDSLRAQKTQAEADLQKEENRVAAGLSIQSELLSARETVSSADASILSAESNLAKTKENLCLMLGWSYGADVEIGELPEPDLESIDAIDLTADIQTALDNNYAYKKTARQLTNARTTKVRDTLTQTQKNQKEAIANSVQDSYSSLILARSDYEQAQQACEIQKNSYESAARKLQAGTITQNDYQTQETAYQNAEVTVRTQKLALLEAMVDYQWAVAGLADAS